MRAYSFAFGVLAFGLASSANAVVLGPGGFGIVDSQIFVLGSEQAVVLQPVVGENALNEVRFTGELSADAFLEQSGFYTFYYRFANSANSADAVHRFTMTGFSGYTVDAFYLGLEAGNVFPLFADRSNDGNTVGFTYLPRIVGGNGEVDPGMTTFIMGIRTNATNYKLGTTSIINGAVDTVQTFAPAVPEPASMAILGVGLVALLRRRQR